MSRFRRVPVSHSSPHHAGYVHVHDPRPQKSIQATTLAKKTVKVGAEIPPIRPDARPIRREHIVSACTHSRRGQKSLGLTTLVHAILCCSSTKHPYYLPLLAGSQVHYIAHSPRTTRCLQQQHPWSSRKQIFPLILKSKHDIDILRKPRTSGDSRAPPLLGYIDVLKVGFIAASQLVPIQKPRVPHFDGHR